MNHGTDAFAFMHEVEGLVDFLQWHCERNEFVHLYFTAKVLLHVARKLRPSFNSSEGRTTPDPPSDKLKWTGAYFLSGARDTNDHRFTPAFVATFQCGTHQFHIADTLE